MTIETKWNIGDVVWSFVKHTRDKDVPCKACNGEGGANIPGTGVRVECQECHGTGEVEAHWYSIDVWRAEITNIDVRVDHRGAMVSYDMTGFWKTGERLGSHFSSPECNTYPDKASAHAEANRIADGLEDARVGGV